MRCTKLLSLCLTVLISFFGNGPNCVGQSSTEPSSKPGEITNQAIFDPPNLIWDSIRECPDIDCIAAIIRKAGASERAIEVVRLLKGESFLTTFKEMGRVDFAEAFDPFMANANKRLLLVNGNPQILDVEDSIGLSRIDTVNTGEVRLLGAWQGRQKEIDISHDPLYPILIKRFPQLTIGGYPSFDGMLRLPTGGQRFTFKFQLVNGCRACWANGYAHIAYDFDRAGVFIGTKLLRLSKIAVVNQRQATRKQSKRVSTDPQSKPNKAGLIRPPLIATLEGQSVFSPFSPDGHIITTVIDRENGKFTVKLWEAASGNLLLSLDRSFAGYPPIEFSPDSRLLKVKYYTSSSQEEAVDELWEISSDRRIGLWSGAGGSFSSFFSPDSKIVGAKENSGRVEISRLFDTSSGNLILSVKGELQLRGFSPDGRLAALSNNPVVDIGNKRTELWDITNQHLVSSFDGSFVGFSGDGQLLAVEDNGETNLWNISGKQVATLQGKAMCFSPDRQLLTTKNGNIVKIWKLPGGELLSSAESLEDIYFSPDGQFIATKVIDPKISKSNPVVKIWEIKTGREISSIVGDLHSGGCTNAIETSPFYSDGELIATENTDNKKSVTKIWRAKDGKSLLSLEGGFRGFSSDGLLLATEVWWQNPAQHTTKIWQVDNGQLVTSLEGYPISFSHDGTLFITGVSKSVKVWRLK